jgi:hypothetical protein
LPCKSSLGAVYTLLGEETRSPKPDPGIDKGVDTMLVH